MFTLGKKQKQDLSVGGEAMTKLRALAAFAAFAQNPGLIPRTHSSQLSIILVQRNQCSLFQPPWAPDMHTHGTQTYAKTPIHINKNLVMKTRPFIAKQKSSTGEKHSIPLHETSRKINSETKRKGV